MIAGLVLASTSAFAATNVGTGTVTGSGGLTTSVVWNDTFPGTATGTVNGIVIKAKVKPSLNFVVSADTIDLGTLDSATTSSGSVDIEVGTNAANGASITARSTKGGLQNSSDTNIYINNATTTNDPIADSYTYASSLVGAPDSAFSGAFTQTPMTAVEVNNTTTPHPIYASNKPQALSVGTDDFKFTVAAKPDAQTPAGDYGDLVVLTVTGNF